MENWRFYYDRGIDYKLKGDFVKSAEDHLKVLEIAPNLNYKDEIFGVEWSNSIKGLILFCKELQLQDLDGMRYTLS